ncbi:MAG: serine/threonine-protein kinase [Polyangiales bacterium]
MSEMEFAETAVADPYVGAVAQGKYRFVRKLGEGGMGAVYEGENLAIKRKVAIKCLHPQLARNASVVYRFRNEALAATQIGNEHIVDVLDMGQMPDGAFFLVLEFLEGTDLSGVLEVEGILDARRAIAIVRQVLAALEAAHRAGIVHRDIKPENVFLVRRGGRADFVKLLDFGIAKISNGTEPSMRTATGSQLGTPYYMPPEQAMGQSDLDARADIYATAVMLYRCLSGRFPFEGDSLPLLMYSICHTDAVDLALYRPDLPRELTIAVMGALSKDRERRPGSAALFDAELERVAVAVDARAVATVEPTVVAARSAGEGSTAVAASTATQRTTLGASASAVDIERVLGRDRSKARRSTVVASAIATAVIATAMVLSRGRAESGAARVASERGPAPSAERAPAAPVVRAEARAPGLAAVGANDRRVQVQITASPASAAIVLDGRSLNNPYDGELIARGSARLEIRAPGFRTELRTIDLSESQRIRVTLERGAGTLVVQREARRPQVAPVAPSEGTRPSTNAALSSSSSSSSSSSASVSPAAAARPVTATQGSATTIPTASATPAGLRDPGEL